MARFDRFAAWWEEWDAGPLIRLALWSMLAVGFARRHWPISPAEVMARFLSVGVGTLLVSCALFRLGLVAAGFAVRAYFIADDLLYGLSERLVLAVWRPPCRAALLLSAIALELSLVVLLVLLGGLWISA